MRRFLAAIFALALSFTSMANVANASTSSAPTTSFPEDPGFPF